MMDIIFGVNYNILKEAIGMRYPPEDTADKHRRILEQAGRLFRERGFGGVSVSEIMKATGLTHGPFYNHFDSKDALMRETLDDLSAKTLQDFDRIAGEEGVGAYLDRYLSRRHVDHPGAGCLMTSLVIDAGKAGAARTSFTTHVKETLARLLRFLPGRSRKQTEAQTRADALRMLAGMVGAVMLARAIDDAALGDEILAAVRTGADD
jgi:TetR/AcrR family transcriptional repressor of nem operon